MEPDELDAADAGGVGLRPDHHGGVGGDPGQEEARLVKHVLQRVVGGSEELGHRLSGAGLELLLAGEVVDEVPVALVGGDPPGRGVGMGDVPLPLEDGHLVADGGAGHPEPRAAGDRVGPDRLAGLDVLLDQGLEDGGLAFVHGTPREVYRPEGAQRHAQRPLSRRNAPAAGGPWPRWRGAARQA